MRKIFVLDTNVLLHNAELDRRVRRQRRGPAHGGHRGARQVQEAQRRARPQRPAGDPPPRRAARQGEPARRRADGQRRHAAHRHQRRRRRRRRRARRADAPTTGSCAWPTQLHRSGERVIFVSKDINARIKADALGHRGARTSRSRRSTSTSCTPGYREITVSREMIDALLARASDRRCRRASGLFPNEFVLLRDETNEKHTALARVRDGRHARAPVQRSTSASGTSRPRNKEQRHGPRAADGPDVQIVTLVGQAGTGKTLLALAAGLHERAADQQLRQDPRLAARSCPMGKDIGYLPGAKDEKLSTGCSRSSTTSPTCCARRGGTARSQADQTVQRKVEELLRKNLIELEALTYIRGRSIPRPVRDRRRGPEPHAARGQDHRQPRGRGHQDGAHRRPLPDRQPVPGLVEQRPDLRGRAPQDGDASTAT